MVITPSSLLLLPSCQPRNDKHCPRVPLYCHLSRTDIKERSGVERCLQPDSGLPRRRAWLASLREPSLDASVARSSSSSSAALDRREVGSDRSQTAGSLRLAEDADNAGPVKGGKMAPSLRSMGNTGLNFLMIAQGGTDMHQFADACLPLVGQFYGEWLHAGR